MTPAVSRYYDDDKTVRPSVCLPASWLCVLLLLRPPPRVFTSTSSAANHTACSMMEEQGKWR